MILISNDGIIIRIAVADVNVMSRYAGGVRVMRLADGDKVVAFAAVEHEEDADEETGTVEEVPEDAEVSEEEEADAAENTETE